MAIDLDKQQFTVQDVLACCPRLEQETFRNWRDREIVILTAPDNPGRGRRPLFTGRDIIQVAAINGLVRLGMMVGKASIAWAMTLRPRLIQLDMGTASDAGAGLALFHDHPITGELMGLMTSFNQDCPALEDDDGPANLIMVLFDKEVFQTIKKLESIIETGTVPPPKLNYTDVQGEIDAMFYEKDDQGRKVRIGLTHEETEELQALQSNSDRRREQSSRYLELTDKSDAEAQRQIAARMDARNKE